MKCFHTHIAACLLITVSCLVWAAGISFVVVSWFELSSKAGWIISGSMGFSAIVLAFVTTHELRNAIELPDYVDPADAPAGSPIKKKNEPSKAQSRVEAF